MPAFHCPPEALHRCWDNSLPPVLAIEPGDTVTYSTVDARDSTVPPPPWALARPSSQERGLWPSIPAHHPLCGPIAVNGAHPGDTLTIEVLEILPHEWGWTASVANGLLGEEGLPYARVYWDLRGDRAVPWSAEGRASLPVRIPKQPFCGVMGVAPAQPGEHSTVPPRLVGGNLDVRHLTTGSTLFLPVAVEGAIFSVGDVHAAQGDGEICGTGIECGASVTLRFDLRRGRPLETPEFTSPWTPIPGPRYGVCGVAPDLMQATREAVRRMIAYLQSEHDLGFDDAYILCSVAVDLTISEVVDPPNWVVSALLPLEVLTTTRS